MAQACFYNVEHGDYITISTDNNISIVRDCGTLDSTTQNWLANNLPIHSCKYNNSNVHEAMVTHPHKDHYSGFELLKQYISPDSKVFDTCYVPILYLNSTQKDIDLLNEHKYNDKELSLTALAVKVACQLQTLLPIGTKVKNPTNWLRVAPLMADLSTKLIGVYAGCSFLNHWKPQGTVLWPPHLCSDYYDKNKDSLIRLLDNGLSSNNELDKIVCDILNEIEGIKNNTQNDDPVNYSQTIDDTLASLSQLRIANRVDAANAEKHARQFGTFIDDHSIVFSIGSDNESSLFLSDLNKSAMNKMVNEMNKLGIKEHYGLVKSAHHGTRLSSMLYRRLMAPHTVVHSCGEGHAKSLEPTNLYSKLGAQVYCTSWRTTSWNQPCPYIQFRGKCKNYNI